MADQFHSHALADPAGMQQRGAGRADGVEALCIHDATAPFLDADNDAYAVSPEEQAKVVTSPAAES